MARPTLPAKFAGMMHTPQTRPVGDHLREWRRRRRLSQLDLALDAEISTRHLSFIETGRSQPSRDMVLRLADQLEIPQRERNVLLVSAGFAPVFPERPLDHPGMAAARQAVELVLAAHEPWPALAVDRHWNLVAANRAVGALLAAEDQSLLAPPVNILRLSLHPQGLAPIIVNFADWRAHALERLHRQVAASADPVLAQLHAELATLPSPPGAARDVAHEDFSGVAVPLQLRTPIGELNFFSTVTVFGTPVDVTLTELAIESFFPADPQTAEALRGVQLPSH
ncbi:MAG TPA: helix-turn-helix transcriptional regulator [Phenylobacterium sp.]|nr:helix-turn-helix transcriptional regulator [Phenylobacterium sp.]